MKRVCLIFITFTVLSTFGVQAEEGDITAEKWRCFAPSDFNKNTVLVELTRVTVADGTQGSGQVSVAGVTHPALFRINGINRRWDFGKEMNYAFIVKPDGRGSYYDFSWIEDGETTGPSQLFNCVSP